MTPAERLHAAADRIEGLAKEVTSPPWEAVTHRADRKMAFMNGSVIQKGDPVAYEVDPVAVVEGNGTGGVSSEADAAWIATMSPVIAGPLVDLLIAVHDDIVRYGHDETISYQAEALALADAILGGSTT